MILSRSSSQVCLYKTLYTIIHVRANTYVYEVSSMESSIEQLFLVCFALRVSGEVKCSLNVSRRMKETKRHGKVVGNRKMLDTSVLLDK